MQTHLGIYMKTENNKGYTLYDIQSIYIVGNNY